MWIFNDQQIVGQLKKIYFSQSFTGQRKMVGKENSKLQVKVENSHNLLIDTSLSSPTNSLTRQDHSLSLLSPQSTSSSHSSTSTSTHSFSFTSDSSKAIIKYEESESTLGNDKIDRWVMKEPTWKLNSTKVEWKDIVRKFARFIISSRYWDSSSISNWTVQIPWKHSFISKLISYTVNYILQLGGLQSR